MPETIDPKDLRRTTLLGDLFINVENASKYPVKARIVMNAEDGEIAILIEDDET